MNVSLLFQFKTHKLNNFFYRGNIIGNDISSGETIVDYMRPYPPKGTGYHRYVYVLYKQTEKVDFSSLKQELPW